MNQTKLKLVAICAILLLPSVGIANSHHSNDQVNEIVEELFVGDIVYSQKAYEFQVKTGFKWSKKDPMAFGVPLSFELGVSDRFEINLGTEAQFFRPADTTKHLIKKIQLGGKYNFFNSRKLGWSASSGVNFKFAPAIKRDMHKFTVSPVFSVYKSCGIFGINGSATVDVTRQIAEAANLEVETELALSILARLGSFVPVVEFATSFEDKILMEVVPGIIFKPGWGLEIGAAAGINVMNHDYPVRALFTLTRDWDFSRS